MEKMFLMISIPKQGNHTSVIVGPVDVAHIGAKIAPPNPKDTKMMLLLRTGWEAVIKTAYDGQGEQKVILITVINL